MSDNSSVQTVKAAYDAFGRGDIKALLGMVDDNVEWHALKGAEGVAPHAGARRGRAAVEQFFSQLAESMEVRRFEPKEFIADGDKVAVVGEYEWLIRTTGKPMKADWVMVFTVRNGKVTQFREWTDTAALVRAYS
jgi:uncharacterized protein